LGEESEAAGRLLVYTLMRRLEEAGVHSGAESARSPVGEMLLASPLPGD